MKKRKLSKKEILDGRQEAFLRHIKSTFKERRVETSKPMTITIDKGGKYLIDPEKNDSLKTFVIVGWVANNEMKEFCMTFHDHNEALALAKTFRKTYKNSRMLEAIK